MIYDVIGWCGAALVLITYMLISTKRIKNGYLYHTLNLLAGLFLAIGLLPKNAWFSFSLQIILIIIAIIGLIKVKK